MANDITMNVNIKNTISSSLAKIQKKLDALPKEAFNEFVKETPIRSGNARRNTKLVGDEIRANYPYAKRLDEGYSQQSPDGMVKPTEAFLQKRMKQILRGK
ncbi:hypothetical protein UFOVP623_22 [uncultured Caudovirales phage]|uniref:HK97 gp10 family phage protein n=1 Tax=uncultured Caudovirales phage TaxID=2100421 RepID=A0A6J5N5S0_9CAUD|nr:hypothetical protein UFOVP623_22 [uncultured Caudovirales phage]